MDKLIDAVPPVLIIGLSLCIYSFGYHIGSRSNRFLTELKQLRDFVSSNLISLDKDLAKINARLSRLERFVQFDEDTD